jgi:2-C-methyl-D-erythritol 4-phosphate cytidylyltransferase/2-C-methyl-D-erythritol 2,4-cyclodiphosphate synthase
MPPRGIAGTIDRSGLFAAQTPQAFRFGVLLDAHRAAAASGRSDFTDDASLLEWRGERVRLVPGSADNFKITAPDDFARAERLLRVVEEVRTGIGYDVHAFGDGDHVMLGGVRIAHDRGVLAHSDGDVVLHALTDALLGAIGDADIGRHFPPSDPTWRGASSDRFLAFAVEQVRRRGGRITHLDVTIVAETPRVGPHREAMLARLADIAGIEPDRISIKATTSEKLGFTGRREGLAALAAATVSLHQGL